MLPEPDEQVARKAHALPAHVQEQVVVREDEDEHRSDEEVEVAEELATVWILGHVAERVHVDECAHDRDEQDEHHRQLVELEGHVGLELTGKDPGEQALPDRALVGCAAHKADDHEDAEHGGCRYGEDRKVRTPPIRASPAEQEYDRAEQWQCDEQPDQ